MKKEKNCWTQRVKNISYHDLKHIKLASIAFAFFIISVWPAAYAWVGKTHWAWYLTLALLFSVKPLISFWGRKK